jgi:hypothetical protein
MARDSTAIDAFQDQIGTRQLVETHIDWCVHC